MSLVSPALSGTTGQLSSDGFMPSSGATEAPVSEVREMLLRYAGAVTRRVWFVMVISMRAAQSHQQATSSSAAGLSQAQSEPVANAIIAAKAAAIPSATTGPTRAAPLARTTCVTVARGSIDSGSVGVKSSPSRYSAAALRISTAQLQSMGGARERVCEVAVLLASRNTRIFPPWNVRCGAAGGGRVRTSPERSPRRDLAITTKESP